MTHIEKVQNTNNVNAAHTAPNTAPPIPFPIDPAIPACGLHDPTLDPNWPNGLEAYVYDGSGYMQVIQHELTYIANHGSTGALTILRNTYARLAERGLLTPAFQGILNQCNIVNLMKDGIEQDADWAFIQGYDATKTPPSPDPATAGTWQALSNYVTAVQNTLQQVQAAVGGPGKDSNIDGLLTDTETILSGAYKNQFMVSHSCASPSQFPATDAFGNVISAGDIVWSYTDPTTSKTSYYDWTKANAGTANPSNDKKELQTIENLITGSSGASGDDHADMTFLGSVLTQMQEQDALETFFTVLKETGDVGLAILAFLYSFEGSKMNELGGTADTMDKQNQASQVAKSLEDYLKTFSATSDASTFRGLVQSLFTQIDSSNQLDSLSDAVSTAVSTLGTTMLPWPPAAPTTTRSVWDLMTDPTVSAKDFQASLALGITPTPVAGGTSPTETLQGLLGAIGGIVTAVSSASTQGTTTSSQLQSLIQAIDKPMTGVIDPNMGMDTAVNKTAINHQTGN